MDLRIAMGDFGRMICSISDGSSSAVATASDFGRACDDLASAIDALDRNGIGECYWPEGAGEYRWVFRRDGDRVRVAVLWSAGVMTGWEHVFWTECGGADLIASARRELVRVATPAL
jgi:hypothetical protein